LALREHVREASTVYEIPEALIWAVIRVESNFAPLAVSCDRALGLMQLLGTTAAEMGVTRPFDPRQNVLGGTRYLRMLADRWNGNIVLTIASYNAGPGAVARYGRVPPFAETQRYVKRVLTYFYSYGRLAATTAGRSAERL
jgi:soluble lytic murein transglycosylase-like protein